MLVKISAHLKELSTKSPAVRRQFYPEVEEEEEASENCKDPLLEEKHTAVRGLVHKYKNRVLILCTMHCAAYCRFCTRQRVVSDIQNGILTDADIENMRSYILKHPEIREIIFSGGDPLTVPPILRKLLTELSSLPQVKIVRIGTRVPVSDPERINGEIIQMLKIVKNKPLYLMVHFEHPDEITAKTEKAIKKLRGAGCLLFSQSVFLKGVNDDYRTLYDLFSRLVEIGVKPYYLFRCDPVEGAERFIVDIRKEIEIASKLRRNLSGLACPMYIIDVPNGSGKVPVALDFWNTNLDEYRDFEGKEIALQTTD